MAKESIKFEDKKSEELYTWVNEEWSIEKLASNPLFQTECLGALKTLHHLGYDYDWIAFRKNTILLAMTLLR